MQQLEYLFKQDLKKNYLTKRKLQIKSSFTQIVSLPCVGASSLIFSFLNSQPPNSYLYINLDDYRIDKKLLSKNIDTFCQNNNIKTIAIAHYDSSFKLPNVSQIIISTNTILDLPKFEILYLMPLSFEEFLALNKRFDTIDNAFSHFINRGGFPKLIEVANENKYIYMQNFLKLHIGDLELEILGFICEYMGSKISIFHMYERFKRKGKISKDHFYKTFYKLINQRWILWLEKFAYPKAIKKIYLIDFAIKEALTFSKNFSQVFETLIFLELKKAKKKVYYDENINFYIPKENRVIIPVPFATDKLLFNLMEKIEGWLINHNIGKMEVVTMSSESKLDHPFIKVEMIAFARWALIES